MIAAFMTLSYQEYLDQQMSSFYRLDCGFVRSDKAKYTDCVMV